MIDPFFSFIVLCAALAGLIKSARWAVSSAEHIGKVLGITPFIIGVFIIGFGTSLPEVVTAFIAVLYGGASEIPVANVVGSNITMMCLVFALAAVYAATRVNRSVDMVRRKQHLYLFAFTTCLFLLFAADQTVVWYEGVVLTGILFWYIGWLVVCTYRGKIPRTVFGDSPPDRADIYAPFSIFKDVFILVAGMVCIFISSYILITYLKIFAGALSLSVDTVSLTLLAVGTSVPEIVVTVVALVKKKSIDLVMGGIISTMIFNIGATIGFVALLSPLFVERSTFFIGLPTLALATAVFFFIVFTQKVSRPVGIALLLLFVSFLYIITVQ